MAEAKANQPSTRVTPVVIHNGVAYVSGQLPRQNGTLAFSGKVGREVSLDDAQAAARLSVSACLDHISTELGAEGRVIRILKITGFVASEEGFTQQGVVIDAASDIILERFGEAGRHARSAIGVAELPHGAAVEIEMIAAVTV